MLESDRHRTECAGAVVFHTLARPTDMGVAARRLRCKRITWPSLRANIAETLLVVGTRVQGEKDNQHTPISPGCNGVTLLWLAS